MNTDYKYIFFREVSKNDKTSIWAIYNTNSHAVLGQIKWYGPWRQYCLFTIDGIIFNDGCLDNIKDFMKQLMDARK